MSMNHKKKSFYKILSPIIYSIGGLASFSACAETIEPVMFYDKPLYSFGGKTPHIVMPLSTEFPMSAAAWNYPRVAYADLPLLVKLMTNKEVYVNQRYMIGYNEYISPANPVTKFARFTDAQKSSPHLGYFNHQLCYRYNTASGGYFEPVSGSDGVSCGSNFSGNYMNWVSMTTLDLLRYTLTGGSRYLDLPNKTILKRARVAEYDEMMVGFETEKEKVDRGVDFRSTLAPTKYIENSTGMLPALGHKYAQNCGNNIYFSDLPQVLYPREKYPLNLLDKLDEKGNVITQYSCDELKETQFLKKYSMRVEVCTAEDAALRPQYCKGYPNGNFKPEGLLQKNSSNARFSLFSYLNISPDLVKTLNSLGINPRNTYAEDSVYKFRAWIQEVYDYAWGGVMRAPAKFIGKNGYDIDMNFYDNNQAEWDSKTGEIIMDNNHTKVAGVITPKTDSDLLRASYANVYKGSESTAQGSSIINYINEFGYYDKYRNQDNLAELVGQTIRYLGDFGSSNGGNLTSGDDSTSSDPHTWFHRLDPVKSRNITTYKQTISSLTDTFPFVKFWGQWGAEHDATRSVCEKNSSVMITVADTNNWRQRYETSAPTYCYAGGCGSAWTAYGSYSGSYGGGYGGGYGYGGGSSSGWHTTALGERDDTYFYTRTVKQILDEIGAKGFHSYSTALSSSHSLERTTPYPDHSQNRYILASLLAGANLYGLNRRDDLFPVVKVKSMIVDVGEPELDNLGEYITDTPTDCHLYTAGVYGTFTQAEINSFNTTGLCNRFANARKDLLSGSAGAIQNMENLLPSKGYFYPTTPNKMVEYLSKAFQVPVEVSGNISAGVTQNLDWQEDGSREVYRFQNNLRTNASSLDTSISTELKKYQMYLDAADGNKVKSKETADTKDWEGNVKWTLRNHATRNVILGGGFKDGTDGKPTLERNNAVNFTYADINTAGDADAISTLKLGLSEKVTPSLDLTTLVKKRIDYIRGSSADEQTSTDKKVFRKRDFVLGSTSNSTIEYYPPSDKYGRSMLYLTSNDGMLHGIDADEGRVMFSYIPRETLPKMYDIDMQGYVAKPLVEGAPVARTIIPNNQKKYSKPVTIVASGFGAGAKGVFALDVSNLHHSRKLNVSPSNVIFEFTDKDDPDMGYFIGQPSFVTVWTGEYRDSQGKMQDKLESFVAVTSGYNNINSTTTYDEAGQPKNKMYLFLLKTDRKYGTPWKLGECDSCNYRKIEITDSDMKNVTNNGLTAPRIIGYGSRTVYFYMGDLQGNLWRYSYDAKAFEGGVSPYDSEVKVKKVFKSSNENTLRPITSRPTVALSKDGGLTVAFGTGRYFGINDLNDKEVRQQSLIAVRDRLGDKTFTLSDLAKREMRRDLTINKVGNDDNLANGWYVNFDNSREGERSLFSPRIKDNTVIFTTQLIGDFSKRECGQNSGTISYADLSTGLGAYSKIENKFVGEALVMPAMKMLGSFDNRQFSEQGGMLANTTYVFAGGATDATATFAVNQNDESNRASVAIPTKSVKGRLSWREIVKSGIQ